MHVWYMKTTRFDKMIKQLSSANCLVSHHVYQVAIAITQAAVKTIPLHSLRAYIKGTTDIRCTVSENRKCHNWFQKEMIVTLAYLWDVY